VFFIPELDLYDKKPGLDGPAFIFVKSDIMKKGGFRWSKH